MYLFFVPLALYILKQTDSGCSNIDGFGQGYKQQGQHGMLPPPSRDAQSGCVKHSAGSAGTSTATLTLITLTQTPNCTFWSIQCFRNLLGLRVLLNC